MPSRRPPFIAGEGIPVLFAAALGSWLAVEHYGVPAALAGGAVLAVLYLVFRDPERAVPAVPLGVVSPVDGRVVAVERLTSGVLQGEAQRVLMRINAFGTYTARCPVEGKIMDLNAAAAEGGAAYPANALWVQTDESKDVVLRFSGYRFGLAPRSFVRYGERIGQGQRCAYLRLTRYAEVHLPATARVTTEPGQVLAAGRDLLAKLPHP